MLRIRDGKVVLRKQDTPSLGDCCCLNYDPGCASCLPCYNGRIDRYSHICGPVNMIINISGVSTQLKIKSLNLQGTTQTPIEYILNCADSRLNRTVIVNLFSFYQCGKSVGADCSDVNFCNSSGPPLTLPTNICCSSVRNGGFYTNQFTGITYNPIYNRDWLFTTWSVFPEIIHHPGGNLFLGTNQFGPQFVNYPKSTLISIRTSSTFYVQNKFRTSNSLCSNSNLDGNPGGGLFDIELHYSCTARYIYQFPTSNNLGTSPELPNCSDISGTKVANKVYENQQWGYQLGNLGTYQDQLTFPGSINFNFSV